VEKDAPKHMRGLAFGELKGKVVWMLEAKNGVTDVQYNWDVVTNKSVDELVCFLLKPVFKYNHDVVMKWEGLASKLNAELPSS